MMKQTILESELKVLDILWNEGDTTARDLILKLKESADWVNTTTLQVIRQCIASGLIERTKSNFIYRAIITREEAKKQVTSVLVDEMFDGGYSDSLISSLLGTSKLAPSQINALRQMVQEFNVSNN